MTEQLPQRFRYYPKPAGPWMYGACFPIEDCGISWWWIRTLCGHASFDDDPWEVLGHVIGDVEEFEWIDNDFEWHGRMMGQGTEPMAELPRKSDDDGGPAFPGAVGNLGMSLRAYAAIHLRVPNSGITWLDDMIRQSQHNDFAGQALAAIAGTGVEFNYSPEHIASVANRLSDAMLVETEKPAKTYPDAEAAETLAEREKRNAD